MKRFLLTVLLLPHLLSAQTFGTKSGFAGFYSKTPLEDIKAENNQVSAVVDAGKKNLAFSLLVKGFTFPKQLMQDHFNENYAESDQYPRATFSGRYDGTMDAASDGRYPVMVRGQLTFHGVTRAIEVPATLEVQGDALSG